MAEGEFVLMEQHLEAALKLAAQVATAPGSDHNLYALLADGAARRRELPALRKWAPLAEETALGLDHRMNLAIARRARGVAHTLTGEFAEAEQRLKQALELFAEYPAPWQIGRTHLEWGELARARGEVDAARAHYEQALTAFEELRAVPDSQRTRSALESLEAS